MAGICLKVHNQCILNLSKSVCRAKKQRTDITQSTAQECLYGWLTSMLYYNDLWMTGLEYEPIHSCQTVLKAPLTFPGTCLILPTAPKKTITNSRLDFVFPLLVHQSLSSNKVKALPIANKKKIIYLKPWLRSGAHSVTMFLFVKHQCGRKCPG